MQVFLSHSSRDAAIAGQICERLERSGVQCFIAPRDIRPGKEYAEEIINGLDESAAMVLLMSQSANSSPHVLREVEHAVSGGTPILVYKIEEVALSKSMEYFLMTHQWVNAKPREDYADIVAFAQDLAAREKAGQGSGGCETLSRVQSGARSAVGGDNRRHGGAVGGDSGRHGGAAGGDSGRHRGIVGRKAGIFAALAAVLVIAAIACLAIRGFGTAQDKPEPACVSVGETVLFGSYLNEDIAWRVLCINEDGTEAVLVAAHILTMKAYDAAESGRYNYDGDIDYWTRGAEVNADMALQARVRGNSDWSESNLRAWLNADTEVVAYSGQPPVAAAMAEKKNGYQTEAGFLYGFTPEERGAIVETELVTKGNALSTADSVITHDRVWLLSLEELAWFDQAGISKFASPTEAAVEQDQSYWYQLDYDTYGVENYSWWLREPVQGMASLCYLVNNGYLAEITRQENAGLEGFGVRPTLTVDLRLVTFRGAESGE
ncbi:MAG: toll/interleukin-1 receptor domain-containing protein [bacterium]|nr:toll/interleukin-1 receptor domain-containing protein [bacterium]MCM1376360.1 toll/interleukin-1 receptor domain-containing protein [Muribaculum sp.]